METRSGFWNKSVLETELKIYGFEEERRTVQHWFFTFYKGLGGKLRKF
jgi:hypothetical protein